MSEGYINTTQARELIGLTNTRSEITQLSNLFRKWRDDGWLKQTGKKGEWQFTSF
jgi:hypothetical protein